MVMLFLTLLACGGPERPSDPVRVAGGWIHSDELLGGQPVGQSGRWFSEDGQGLPKEATDTREPSCEPIFSVDLGDVERHIAQGGSAPDTATSFSDDGRRLAIGSFLGEVLIVDGWTGIVEARKRLAETMVKQVAWSSNGDTIYVAEQSPDGSVVALSVPSLDERWRVNLSDWLESSPLPAGDIYGAYTLPAAYSLDRLTNGDLLVVGTHAWNDKEGTRLNRAIILRLTPEGKVVAQWPKKPLDAVLFRGRISGPTALIPVSKSSPGPADESLPIGGALIFNLDAFEPAADIRIPPLKPLFTNTFLWEALDISGDTVFLGLSDGRAGLWTVAGEPLLSLPSSEPMLAGEVPVVASIGSGIIHAGRSVYQTSTTHIPFGAAAPELRPPAAHPGENTLMVADNAGNLVGSWRGPHRLQGLTMSPDNRHLVVGAGKREADGRRDLFGALVFDMGPENEPFDQPRLSRFCRTSGPVFFRTSPMADGRIAVTEHPYRQGENPAFGRYQVTVFR
jgi:WD40 repeat protein